MNDFCKYVSFSPFFYKVNNSSVLTYFVYFSFSMTEKLHGLNQSDVPGPNIYIATRDAFTGLHVDNNYAVLAVHHNLIGTNKVTMFKTLNDVESAQSFWKHFIQVSQEAGHDIDQKLNTDIFDTLKFSSQVSPNM